MDGDLFEGWLEQVLVTVLKNPEKSVIFLDNASPHKKDRIYDIAADYGFKVIFLPPYSPDYNKIEKFWANVKNRLRKNMHNFFNFWDALSYAFKGTQLYNFSILLRKLTSKSADITPTSFVLFSFLEFFV